MSRNQPEWYRRTRAEKDPEKITQMVTMMIISDEFLKRISPLLEDLSFLKSSAGHLTTVIQWAMNHHKKFGRAPRDYMNKIFEANKAINDDAQMKLIKLFLTNINKQYVLGNYDDIDVNYELDQAESYIQERAIFFSDDQVRTLIKQDRVKEANDLRYNFKIPKLKDDKNNAILEDTIISYADLMKKDIEVPKMILSPWLSDASSNMIFAPRGIGKTWICLITAAVITRSSCRDIEFGPWHCDNPAGVLYIDGEMLQYHFRQRLKKINYNLQKKGFDERGSIMSIISNDAVAQKYKGTQINLSSKMWQDTIYDYISNDDRYNLLILDNLSSLTPGLDENSKDDWDPVNQWILALRHLGVSVIFVHHAGKSGKQRGTSAREDALDTIMNINKASLEGVNPDKINRDAIYINITFPKARNANPDDIKPFTFEIASELGGRSISWKVWEPWKNN